jgi:hypothetical protein
MSDELDEFTAQLNSAGTDKPQQQAAKGPGGGQGGAQPAPTPQQLAQMKAAKEMQEKMAARPLTLETLKGKVDLKWFGHAGFKIQFLDE